MVDEVGRNGQFVLTGSEQFELSRSISQSLAGRTALLRLLPFTLDERRQAGASDEVDDILFAGCYPGFTIRDWIRVRRSAITLKLTSSVTSEGSATFATWRVSSGSSAFVPVV